MDLKRHYSENYKESKRQRHEEDPNVIVNTSASEDVTLDDPDIFDNTSKNEEETSHVPRPWSLCSERLLDSKMKPLISQMNHKQTEVFNYVRDWCQQTSRGENPEPFHLFVNGGAGVGKTHLIQCIYNEASKYLENGKTSTTVLLTAPTGIAAFKVGGFTIHSAFKIPIRKSNYEQLSLKSLEMLKDELRSLKILIIDEISMVSRVILSYIHGRLNEIKDIGSSNKDAVFGNVSILAVGDFYQLPPVKAASLIIPITGQDLWHNNFEMTTLDEVMRQKDDVPFAKLLNRLRLKPKRSMLNKEDNAILLSRNNLDNVPSDALHVFSKICNVDSHNSHMLNACCADTRVLLARDDVLIDSLARTKKAESCDLEQSLELGVGARVMLTRNIELSDGLVNGALGTVVGFQQNNPQSEPDEVCVKFDSENVVMRHRRYGSKDKLDGAIAITRRTEEIKDQSVRRCQFPLKLAWACTIHKTQGMTFDRCVIDLEGIFESGQAYVGLSRVTTLQGLFLRNYRPDLIFMNLSVYNNIGKMKRIISIPALS